MAIRKYDAYAGEHFCTRNALPNFTVSHWGRRQIAERNRVFNAPPGHHDACAAGWYAWSRPPRWDRAPWELPATHVLGPFTSSRKAYQAARAKLGA